MVPWGTANCTTMAMATSTPTDAAASGTAAPVATPADTAALQRLLSWLSPAYPVGAYTYSHGLERAVEDGAVRDRATLAAYVGSVLQAGAGRIDGALLVAAYRAAGEDSAYRDVGDDAYRHVGDDAAYRTAGDDAAYRAAGGDVAYRAAGGDAALDAVADLAAAWRGTAETALETMAQGTAFLRVTRAAWPDARLDAFAARHANNIAHPVALGAAAAWHGVGLRMALFGFLSAFAANLVSAGVRLVPLGQTDGQIATASLLPALEAATEAALSADLDRIGTAAPVLDLFSLRHETQYTRLFRS
jgi:urease accessory protein